MRLTATTAALLCGITTLTSLSAQEFTKQVLEQGLASPTGIALGPNGDLYFTEVPTPGVGGAMSQNTVRVRNAQTGVISMIAMGEPEPVNLAFAGADLYWTCKSVGVIIRRQNGMNAVWKMGLQSPSGIASAPNGDIFITQVPTPGVPAGSNTVDRIVGAGAPIAIGSGEPEPVDIAVDTAGNAYWTCRTAGVILRYDAVTGMKSRVLDGLNQPTGIDVDDNGNIYFTEVPTPGVPGTMGGTNKVWQYEPDSQQFTLISVGEPEPTDVTVTPDGSTVYWTCTSAGVIVQAMRTGSQPDITTPDVTAIGGTVRFFLDAPGLGGQHYMLGNSLGRGPIAVGMDYLALEQDFLLATTFASPNLPFMVGYFGLLDANGMGTAHLVIPPITALQGLVFYTAYGVVDMSGVLGLSKTLRSEIE